MSKEILGNQAYNAAKYAVNTIDPVKFEQLIKNGNENSEYYIEVQNELNKIRQIYSIKYLYTMTKKANGEYIYLVDGLNKNEEGFSPFGSIEVETQYYGDYDKIFVNGEIVKGDYTTSDIWGSLVSSYIPIKTADGRIIAFLGADYDTSEIFGIMDRNTVTTVAMISILSFLAILAAFLFTRRMTNPITKLRDYSMKAVQGETGSQMEINADGEIGDLANVINNRIEAIRNLLNNTEQGFLTFGMDLIINSEYSAQCKEIFNEDIGNYYFPQIIYPNEIEKQELLQTMVDKLFIETEKREVYISLMNEEILVNGKNIRVEYKIIKDTNTNGEKVMTILTDVTQQRKLESRIEIERDILKMVVKTIVYFTDFVDCVKEYNLFCEKGIEEIIDTDKSKEDILYEIFRNIHTFKGNFSQLDMIHIVNILHKFEGELNQLKDKLTAMNKAQLKEFFAKNEMKQWLDLDMTVLNEILGEQYIQKLLNTSNIIVIEKKRLEEIERILSEQLSEIDRRVVIPEIRKLRYKPFRELLEPYQSYVSKIADKLEKNIKIMLIKGGDFLVEQERYMPLSKSLVHIFRNAVDHGIELPNERIEKEKDEYGRIKCSISKENDTIIIKIVDDGSGIDVAAVKKSIIKKGMITVEEAEKLDDNQIMQFIFADEVTTKVKESIFSGRGEGLSAVKAEAEKLGGSIKVTSKFGIGSVFEITIPMEEQEIKNV